MVVFIICNRLWHWGMCASFNFYLLDAPEALESLFSLFFSFFF